MLLCLMHMYNEPHLQLAPYYVLNPPENPPLRHFPKTCYIYLANLIAPCVVRAAALLQPIILFLSVVVW